MRRSLVVAIVLLAIAFVFVGGPSLLLGSSADEVAPSQDESPELITLEGSESGFWEYLSAREAHDRRSPINVIVRGEVDEVVLLLQEADDDWEETDHDHFDADPFTHSVQPGNDTVEDNSTLGPLPTSIPWTEAAGTTRYAYVDPGPNGDPYWTEETLQLDDGDYYGQRFHIRLYGSPNPEDEWVAMQAHTEHFDWFTLRHRVDGVEAAQTRIEKDLMGVPGVDPIEDVRRINLDNSGPSDANGWATLVDLSGMLLAPLLIGLAAGKNTFDRVRTSIDNRLTETDRERIDAVYDRIEARHVILVMAILALYLGVRIMGVFLEQHAQFLTMHMIAALLYPVIAVGIPLVAYLVASGLERRLDAAIVASLSLAVAIWLDYGLLGVDRLPIDVVVQRMILVVALGLIAGGAARRATRDSRFNEMVVTGVGIWVLTLVGTLFGYL